MLIHYFFISGVDTSAAEKWV